jgi:hypothetical protein
MKTILMMTALMLSFLATAHAGLKGELIEQGGKDLGSALKVVRSSDIDEKIISSNLNEAIVRTRSKVADIALKNSKRGYGSKSVAPHSTTIKAGTLEDGYGFRITVTSAVSEDSKTKTLLSFSSDTDTDEVIYNVFDIFNSNNGDAVIGSNNTGRFISIPVDLNNIDNVDNKLIQFAEKFNSDSLAAKANVQLSRKSVRGAK